MRGGRKVAVAALCLSACGALLLLRSLAGLLRPAKACGGLRAPHSADCQALLDFAEATQQRVWARRDGWLSVDTPHCLWLGVACEEGGRVTQLSLDYNRLEGSLPASLGILTQLRTLSLRFNPLSGPVPSSLGRLTQLERLSLSGTALSGTLPASLGGATRLSLLGVSGTQVSGAVPTTVARLPLLRTLTARRSHLGDPPPGGDLCAALARIPHCQLARERTPGCPGATADDAHCDSAAAVVSRRQLILNGTSLTRFIGAHGLFQLASGQALAGDVLDVVVPFHIDTVLQAALYAPSFRASRTVRLFAPSDAELVWLFNNKTLFGAFMATHAHNGGFGGAAARTLREPPTEFPCVLKPAVGVGGGGVHVVRDAREYAQASAALAGQERVLQAYALGGRFATAHYALLRGVPLRRVFYVKRRPRGLSVQRGGIAGYARHLSSPHTPLFDALFRSVNFTGMACVNYVLAGRSTVPGQGLTILEVNPRIGDSLRAEPRDFGPFMTAAVDALEEEWRQGPVEGGEPQQPLCPSSRRVTEAHAGVA